MCDVHHRCRQQPSSAGLYGNQHAILFLERSGTDQIARQPLREGIPVVAQVTGIDALAEAEAGQKSGQIAARQLSSLKHGECEDYLEGMARQPVAVSYTHLDVYKRQAQKTPANWYRTIDRITPTLASRPKLLIPDIKGEAHIVFEDGQLYPHHNLYYVTSDQWELRPLQACLLYTSRCV